MRGDIIDAPAQRRNEMDFAGFLHVLLQPFRTDIAVDGDGNVRPDRPTVD